MRRQDRQIDDENELDEILSNGKYTVISMCRDNEPYIVTLSYGWDKEKNALYLHTGKEGLKIEFLKYNPIVCATIIDDIGYIVNECGHQYRSVVINGKITYVESIEEKKHGMEVILKQLEDIPDIVKARSLKNDEVYGSIEIIRLDVITLTGKKGK